MKFAATTLALLACAALLGACGSQGISVAKTSPYYRGPSCSATTARAATRCRPSVRRARRRRSPTASRRTARTSTSARRTSNRSSTRSATAASRGRSCPRTSSSGPTPSRWPNSSRILGPAGAEGALHEHHAVDQIAAGAACSTSGRSGRTPTASRQALARRGEEAAAGLDEVIGLDARRRELLPQLEGLRAEQNEANTRIRAAADDDGAPGARSRRCARSRRAPRSSSRSWPVSKRAADEPRAAAEPARPHAPRRDPRMSWCASSATPRSSASLPATTSSWRAIGSTWTARRAPLRLALRLPERRPGDARAGARAVGPRASSAAGASSP